MQVQWTHMRTRRRRRKRYYAGRQQTDMATTDTDKTPPSVLQAALTNACRAQNFLSVPKLYHQEDTPPPGNHWRTWHEYVSLAEEECPYSCSFLTSVEWLRPGLLTITIVPCGGTNKMPSRTEPTSGRARGSTAPKWRRSYTTKTSNLATTIPQHHVRGK
jgi:hypothetical protein